MKTYKKPVVTVDAGMAEGVYAASGASQGTLNVTYHGVWDKWELMVARVWQRQTGQVLMEQLL